jgi:hypothetical protein
MRRFSASQSSQARQELGEAFYTRAKGLSEGLCNFETTETKRVVFLFHFDSPYNPAPQKIY